MRPGTSIGRFRPRSAWIAAVAAAALAACAGPEAGRRTVKASSLQGDRAAVREEPKAPARASAKAAREPKRDDDVEERGASARAERLFREAVQAREEQEKLKVPPDWELLARKWRAAAEAGEVAEAWFNLGVCEERLGHADRARDAYDRAVKLKPSLHQAAANLLLLREKELSPREAQAAWAALLKRYPESALPRVRLAASYRAAGQLDDAERLAREALARDPQALGAYEVLLAVEVERGNADMAQLLALRAQKLSPGDPEVLLFSGRALAKRKDDDAAAAEWRRALQREELLPARYELLRQALRRHNWAAAADEAEKILKREPSAPVHLAAGVALRHLEQPDKALAHYAEAERLSGDALAEVHLARGVLLMKAKGSCEPALAEFRRYLSAARETLPGDAPVFKLQRECEAILVANRQAEEAARQLREAEKGVTPASQPAPARDEAAKPPPLGEASPRGASSTRAQLRTVRAEGAAAEPEMLPPEPDPDEPRDPKR